MTPVEGGSHVGEQDEKPCPGFLHIEAPETCPSMESGEVQNFMVCLVILSLPRQEPQMATPTVTQVPGLFHKRSRESLERARAGP